MTMRGNGFLHAPTVSVIIPLYNNRDCVGKAIQSVVAQEYPCVELIVIDGGSTDGSQEIVLDYGERITFFLSEKDTGIYDAMNKGIDKATGDWLFFLGSDDTLEPGVLKGIAAYLSASKTLIYGDVLFENGWRFPSFFSPRTIFQNTVHHQGAFYHRTLFDNFRYDTHLRILSDYELNLIIYQRKMPTQKVPMVIARCGDGGASSQIQLSILETNYVRSKYVKSELLNWLLSILLKIYYGQKAVRSFINENFLGRNKH